MIARIATCIAAIALISPASAIQLTTALDLGPPTVRLDASDVLYATRTATIALPEGDTVLQLPLHELGAEPQDALVEVEPAGSVTLVGSRTAGDPPVTSWRLRADRPVDAVVSLTYPLEGLTWAIAYTATLLPDESMYLQASLRVTNELGRDLEDARLLGDAVSAWLSLNDGQSITVDQPWLSGAVPADVVRRELVYDRARHGDAAMEMLVISPLPPRPADMLGVDLPAYLCGPLPAGRVRIYADTAAGPEFISETALPYTPAGQPVDLRLGPASGVIVTRTLDSSREVDRRLDVRDRTVLFNVLETWVLEVRNLRETPVEMQIRQRHEGYWEIEQSTHAWEQPDAQTLVIGLEIDPGRRAEITYRLRHLNRQP